MFQKSDFPSWINDRVFCTSLGNTDIDGQIKKIYILYYNIRMETYRRLFCIFTTSRFNILVKYLFLSLIYAKYVSTFNIMNNTIDVDS